MDKECTYCHFHVLSFGLALGLLWAFALFIVAIITIAAGGYGEGFIHSIGMMYIGYKPSFVGGLIGAIWGFVDAFVGGVILAWLYNCFSHLFCKSKICKTCE